jgi:peptidoglycan hydrolase CwlO-like protein
MNKALTTANKIQDEIDQARHNIADCGQFIARLQRQIADSRNEIKREERFIDRRLRTLKQTAQDI